MWAVRCSEMDGEFGGRGKGEQGPVDSEEGIGLGNSVLQLHIPSSYSVPMHHRSSEMNISPACRITPLQKWTLSTKVELSTALEAQHRVNKKFEGIIDIVVSDASALTMATETLPMIYLSSLQRSSPWGIYEHEPPSNLGQNSCERPSCLNAANFSQPSPCFCHP